MSHLEDRHIGTASTAARVQSVDAASAASSSHPLRRQHSLTSAGADVYLVMGAHLRTDHAACVKLWRRLCGNCSNLSRSHGPSNRGQDKGRRSGRAC